MLHALTMLLLSTNLVVSFITYAALIYADDMAQSLSSYSHAVTRRYTTIGEDNGRAAHRTTLSLTRSTLRNRQHQSLWMSKLYSIYNTSRWKLYRPAFRLSKRKISRLLLSMTWPPPFLTLVLLTVLSA